jgi:hypothetical protein
MRRPDGLSTDGAEVGSQQGNELSPAHQQPRRRGVSVSLACRSNQAAARAAVGMGVSEPGAAAKILPQTEARLERRATARANGRAGNDRRRVPQWGSAGRESNEGVQGGRRGQFSATEAILTSHDDTINANSTEQWLWKLSRRSDWPRAAVRRLP